VVSIDAPVLILDKTYSPVKIGKTKDAICALFSGKAQVIDQNYNLYDFYKWCEFTKTNRNNPTISDKYGNIINSPSFSLFVPHTIYVSVLCKNPILRGKRKHFKYTRKGVFKRDNLKCQYCGKFGTKSNMTLDHVIPRSRGGKNTYENVVTCCMPCNAKKGNFLVSELGWELLNSPKQPSWVSYIGANWPDVYKQEWEKFL